jgi:hypothetical protein
MDRPSSGAGPDHHIPARPPGMRRRGRPRSPAVLPDPGRHTDSGSGDLTTAAVTATGTMVQTLDRRLATEPASYCTYGA